MTPRRLTTLGDLLDRAEGCDWRGCVYLPDDEPWGLATRCAVLKPWLDDDSHQDERFAAEHGVRGVLDMGSVQSIVQVARRQRPDATRDDLLRSFLHYVQNDAFLNLGKAP